MESKTLSFRQPRLSCRLVLLALFGVLLPESLMGQSGEFLAIEAQLRRMMPGATSFQAQLYHDLLEIVREKPPGLFNNRWTYHDGLCLPKTEQLMRALARTGRYDLSRIMTQGAYFHVHLRVNNITPPILIDPTYRQMIRRGRSVEGSPLFVGTLDDLKGWMARHAKRLKPLSPFDWRKYSVDEFVDRFWGEKGSPRILSQALRAQGFPALTSVKSRSLAKLALLKIGVTVTGAALVAIHARNRRIVESRSRSRESDPSRQAENPPDIEDDDLPRWEP